MSLGNHLFKARKKNGLSQEEAAGKLGVSRQIFWPLFGETAKNSRASQ
ncbi:MAG: helix-turn-helix domain-containing protein [Lachnospiraceae bacterium]|nr:helix-turn-helix domain-containing protein [Lachnospiraceae bacterium]